MAETETGGAAGGTPRDTDSGGRGSDDSATGRTTRRDRPRPNKGAAFKGMTAEMNGHVFQTYSEAENKTSSKTHAKHSAGT